MRKKSFRSYFLILVVLGYGLTISGCGEKSFFTKNDPSKEGASSYRVVKLKEAFLTERNETDDVDSPAIWHGTQGEHWMISTAKATNVLIVNDAATGKFIKHIGGTGTQLGQFKRPNGVAVIDSLVIVVERDNHRVQVMRLPDFKPLGFIGADTLKKPYGLTVFHLEPDRYALYVTDNYETASGQIPPDNELGSRIHYYTFSVQNDKLQSELVLTFGDTNGSGVLKVVESICADPAFGHLLVADESDERNLKVYALDGHFTGTTLGNGFIKTQAEGIALYTTGDSTGFWIATDQDYKTNTFHVFDRQSLKHLGAFSGEVTANTDGIALTRHAFGPFQSGAFYAVHDDGNVAAFSWKEIADSLGLKTNGTIR